MELGNMFFGHSRGQFAFPDRNLADCKEWIELLAAADSDAFYGFCGNFPRRNPHENVRGGYENDTFAINPYWWGDDDNADECNKPNFRYKPTGFEIRWYKYPFRDSYMNMDLTANQIKSIWAACKNSVVAA